MSSSIWFSMEPVYSAPILDTYLKSIPTWSKQSNENGIVLIKILAQIAMSCFVLEKTIGFNHRDLKPDNILVKLDAYKPHTLKWKDELEIHIAPSHTAIMVDFGFSCLGPGKIPWIQAGDGILPPLDPCPKEGRDLFHLIVSLYSVQQISIQFTPQLEKLFEEWMTVDGRATHPMAKKWASSEWIYLLTSTKEFVHPACSPSSILQSIRAFDPTVFT